MTLCVLNLLDGQEDTKELMAFLEDTVTSDNLAMMYILYHRILSNVIVFRP